MNIKINTKIKTKKITLINYNIENKLQINETLEKFIK